LALAGVLAQARLMAGTREILRTQQGLSEHANYHEYCKLLGRLKTNYQVPQQLTSAIPNSIVR
jgi:exportin-7